MKHHQEIQSQSHGVRIGLEDTGLLPGFSVDDADGGSTSDQNVLFWSNRGVMMLANNGDEPWSHDIKYF